MHKAMTSLSFVVKWKSVSHRSGLTEGGFAQFIPFFTGQSILDAFLMQSPYLKKKGQPIVEHAKELFSS